MNWIILFFPILFNNVRFNCCLRRLGRLKQARSPLNDILKLDDLLVHVQGLIEGILGHQHSWKVLSEHVPLIVFYLRKKMQFELNV